VLSWYTALVLCESVSVQCDGVPVLCDVVRGAVYTRVPARHSGRIHAHVEVAFRVLAGPVDAASLSRHWRAHGGGPRGLRVLFQLQRCCRFRGLVVDVVGVVHVGTLLRGPSGVNKFSRSSRVSRVDRFSSFSRFSRFSIVRGISRVSRVSRVSRLSRLRTY
jgi:hypothetical protein